MASRSETLQTIAGTLGNVLEWYDFGIYGFFSDTIAQVFFPPTDDNGQLHENLIYSYLVFGGAFLMRPIGGLVTGHIGDAYGRKRALVFSLFCMTVPTVAMGFLPTYEQVGGWSTALLVICRLLQGFSVGGQLPSSLVYTLETKPKEHWGYYGSFVNAAANSGVILGNLVGALIRTLLNEEQVLRYGWRIAFFTGILILPAAIYLHFCGREHHPNAGEYDSTITDDGLLDETINTEVGEGIIGRQESLTTASQQQKHPLREAVKRENLPALLSSTLVPMLYGGGYYISVVWMAVYMQTLLVPPINGAFWVNLIANVFGLTAISFLAGWLSDRYGRVKLMTFGAVSVGIIGPIMVWIISWANTIQAVFAQTALCFFLSFYCGPFCTWLVERFPTKVRLTSVALGFNIGICLSSGFTPAIATALVKVSEWAPGLIYPVLSIFGLIGLCISRKVHQDGTISDCESEGKETAKGSFLDEDSLHTQLL